MNKMELLAHDLNEARSLMQIQNVDLGAALRLVAGDNHARLHAMKGAINKASAPETLAMLARAIVTLTEASHE